MIDGSDPKERGCGSREKGGVYIETKFGPFGRPWYEFLIEDTQAFPASELGIAPIGVSVLPRGNTGIFDVYDWVGSTHYPNVTDWIEEMLNFGSLSRRVTQQLPFDKLTKESLLITLHRRAWTPQPQVLGNAISRTGGVLGPDFSCRKRTPGHDRAEEIGNARNPFCCGLWWHSIIEGEPIGAVPGQVRRVVGDTTYLANSTPEGGEVPWMVARFGAWPIGQLTVIEHPDDDITDRAVDRASAAALPVVVEKE